MNISFIGVGRLGLCSALCFAEAGFNVLGCDVSPDYIAKLNDKTLISPEPGVTDLLRSVTTFRATTDLKETLNHSDVVFIVVPTPSGENHYDHSILSSLLLSIRDTGLGAAKHLIICCTVMPKYINTVAKSLYQSGRISYNPEFIAQGSIIHDFKNPDMVLIGSETPEDGEKIKDLYSKVLKVEPVYSLMSVLEAEITKIALNGFVTTKIAYANMISELAINLGCNDEKILESIGSDSRIGHKSFKAGFSYGGPCFPRDNKAFSKVLKDNDVYPGIPDATHESNEKHIGFNVDVINTFVKKDNPLTISDVCYKPNCSLPIITESPKIKIALNLVKLGYTIIIKDIKPVINEVMKSYGKVFKYEVTS